MKFSKVVLSLLLGIFSISILTQEDYPDPQSDMTVEQINIPISK